MKTSAPKAFACLRASSKAASATLDASYPTSIFILSSFTNMVGIYHHGTMNSIELKRFLSFWQEFKLYSSFQYRCVSVAECLPIGTILIC